MEYVVKAGERVRSISWGEVIFSLIIGYFCVHLFFGISFRGYRVIKNISTIRYLTRQIPVVEREIKELREKIEYAGTDEFLEREAREKLGLTYPGESIIKFAPQEEKPAERKEKKVISVQSRNTLIDAWKALKELFGR
ncbi:MAG: FtsB family cell division protein [bacterium]